MPSEITKQKIVSVNKRELPISQIVLECKATTENLAKVAMINASATINNFEVLSGSLSYDGELNLSLVYLTDSGEMQTISSSYPFSGTIDSKMFEPEVIADISSIVISITPEDIGANEVRLIANIGISSSINEQVQTEMFSDEKGEYFCHNGLINSCELYKKVENSFEQSGEILVNGKIAKVLSVKVESSINEANVGADYYSVNGENFVYVSYCLSSEEGKINRLKLTLPFKEEFEASGATKEMSIASKVFVKQKNVKIELVEGDSQTKIVVNFPVDVVSKIYNESQYDCIDDVYSTKNEVNQVIESYTYQHHNASVGFESKIDGNITLSPEEMRIDKVIGYVGEEVMQTNSFIDDKELVVEGIIRTNLVYFNDESGSVNTYQVEIPFTVSDRINADFGENTQPDVSIALSEIDLSVKRGREIMVDGKVRVYAELFDTIAGAVMTRVEDGDLLAEKECAIEVYFAQAGKSLWDIAKEMHEDVSLIMAQNPDIGEIIEENKKIVIYRQKIKDFN